MAAEADDRAMALVAAALLRQGRALHHLSLALLLVGTLAAIVAGLSFGLVKGLVLLVAALALAGAASYLAIRVGFDAELFANLARDGLTTEALDRALGTLGLVAGNLPDRPIGERIAGARRLLNRLALLVGLQFLLVPAAMLALILR